jgi:hypothetical protein
MITDLDETIKKLLTDIGKIDHGEIDISFDPPDREWSTSLGNKPTVNLYLYDIRENHELRGTEWYVEKNGNNTATKRKNAKRINLSYMVTVWTKNTDDQHSLLWRVLHTLIRYPTIPPELLTGTLKEQEYPVITSAAQPDGLFGNPADFWAALDNQIKPSFNYVVTLPMDLEIAFTSAVTRTRKLSTKRPDAEAEDMTGISGTVHLKGKPESVVAEAKVVVKGANLSCMTNEAGQYAFTRIPEGKQTLEVLVANKPPRTFEIEVPGPSYDLEI